MKNLTHGTYMNIIFRKPISNGLSLSFNVMSKKVGMFMHSMLTLENFMSSLKARAFFFRQKRMILGMK